MSDILALAFLMILILISLGIVQGLEKLMEK